MSKEIMVAVGVGVGIVAVGYGIHKYREKKKADAFQDAVEKSMDAMFGEFGKMAAGDFTVGGEK